MFFCSLRTKLSTDVAASGENKWTQLQLHGHAVGAGPLPVSKRGWGRHNKKPLLPVVHRSNSAKCLIFLEEQGVA